MENVTFNDGRVAQLDRVPGYEPGGRRFESSRVRHFLKVVKYRDIFKRYKILNDGRVAQLDRVPGYEPGGRRFESSRVRHFSLSG